jgi:hypothetical protein
VILLPQAPKCTTGCLAKLGAFWWGISVLMLLVLLSTVNFTKCFVSQEKHIFNTLRKAMRQQLPALLPSQEPPYLG